MANPLDAFLSYYGLGNSNPYQIQVFANYKYRVPANNQDDNRVVRFFRYVSNTNTETLLKARVITVPEDRIVAYVENNQIFVTSERILFRFLDWHTPISELPLAEQNKLMKEVRNKKRKVEVRWEKSDQQGANERITKVLICNIT